MSNFVSFAGKVFNLDNLVAMDTRGNSDVMIWYTSGAFEPESGDVATAIHSWAKTIALPRDSIQDTLEAGLAEYKRVLAYVGKERYDFALMAALRAMVKRMADQ